jgi:hypothetical protein
MADITTAVELKQPISFVDGDVMYSVDGSVISSVDEWDDISSDVVVAKTFRHDRGISGVDPKSLVASPGRFSFYLNNRDKNSAGLAGYYSPDHANKRDGFEQGAEVRVKYTYSATPYYRWRGRIYNINPDPSPYQAFTEVVAYGWMKEAQEHKFKSTAVATDQRGDQALQTMVDTFPNSKQPEAISLDTGKSTFPYVFDSERDEKTSVMSVLQKIAQSELGKIYINSQGGNGEQLVFENRHHAVDVTAVQHDFDDNVVSVHTAYPFKLVKTKIICMAHPREFDTGDIVLGQIQKSFRVPPNTTKVVKLLFRDPSSGDRISVLSLAARVSGTDYIANAQEGGGGADRTADLTVTENDVSGNSIALNVQNTSGSGWWVTTLQQKGKGIYLFDPATYEAEANQTYVAEKGNRDLRYDLPYEDDYNVAVDFGDYLLSVWKDPICQIKGLTYIPNENATLAQAFCDIDIGHRITVNFTQLGIDQDYFVTRIAVSRQSNKVRCSYSVVPAGTSVYMQLDDAIYGKLDANECKLAF